MSRSTLARARTAHARRHTAHPDRWRRESGRRAAATAAVGALVLGLLPPPAPAEAASSDVPAWAEQGDRTERIGVNGVDGPDYLVHHYTDVDNHPDRFVVPAGVSEVEYLIVGGGGAGGARGGGGGAGGVIEGTQQVGSDPWVHGQEFTVEVGAGGKAATAEGDHSASGGDSALGGLVAKGGGHGGNSDSDRGGADGGSGGGGGHWLSGETQGGEGFSDQGNAGGKGGKIEDEQETFEGWGAGGGGGAEDAGQPAESNGAPGNGGTGITSSISGDERDYAGGGGGHFLEDTGPDAVTMDAGGSGSHGGGNGGSPCGGGPGEANTGGGGGGGDTRTLADEAFEVTEDTNTCSNDTLDTALPRDGGSGVVIIRYAADDVVNVTDVKAEDATLTAGDETTVTVTVEDIDGVRASGTEVTLTTGQDESFGPETTGDDGQAAFTVSHDTAETVTYTATIDGVEMGSVDDVTYTAWTAPASEDQGAFKISSYAGSDTGETESRWWRGYVFTVAEETTVTHLVGSGKQWSTVGLFKAVEAQVDGATRYRAAVQDTGAWDDAVGDTNASEDDKLNALALGWVRIEGNVTDEPKALEDRVTLEPETEYLLAQSAANEDGKIGDDHNRYVERIDREDLLSHPRIGDVWLPEADESLRWEGSDAETIEGGHKDSDELMPLVGFLYDSDASAPEVTTTDPANERFAGTLTDRGGSATTLCFDVGATEVDFERRCVDAVDATTTGGSETVDFALTQEDLAGFASGTLHYRAVAVNETGVALGGWQSAYHAAGTLITRQAFTDSMPEADSGWRFRSKPPTDTADSDYPSIREGHLRLVPAENTWSGSALYDVAQPTSAGLDVSFRTRQFDGDGADGLAFFLTDGATQDIVPGNSGGKLGYVNLDGDGGDGALLGLGLDTFGNFAEEQTEGCDQTYDPTPDALTIRGGAQDDWCVLAAPETITDGWGPERLVRVQVDPDDVDDPEVRVFLDGSLVTSLAQPPSLQAVSTFKFGFSASTGGSNNNHDIWDVDVRSLTALPQIEWSTQSPLPQATFGETYDAGELLVEHGVNPITVEVTEGSLPDGLQIVDQAITGTPTKAGEFTFTLQATDSREPPSSASRAFNLKVATAAPTVATKAASLDGDAPERALDVSGEIIDNGGSALTGRGFVYAEAGGSDPTYGENLGRIDDPEVDQDEFTARVDDLEPNTTYVLRAYAVNAAGTGYGDTLEVTTEPVALTLSGVTVEDRPYDGTTEATVTGGTLNEVRDGDDVAVAGYDTAAFADSDVGQHDVTVGWELEGADAERYALSTTPALSGEIVKAEATLGFTGGLAWPAFDEGDQAATAPSVAVEPEVDAADGDDALASSVEIAYGPDDAPTATQPSDEGTYRVTATLEHPNYGADAVHSTVVVIPPQEDGEDAPEIGPVPDHDDEGEPQAPTRETSTATVTEDGQDVDDVTVSDTQQGEPLEVAAEGGGFRVALDARERSGGPSTGVDAEGRLRLTLGRLLHASGEGFKDGSRVEVWLFSEPRFLGTATVDEAGEFDVEFDVPDDLAAGEHTVQLSGRASDDSVRTTSVGLLVDAAPSTSGPRPEPGQALTRHGGADRVATAATIATDAFADGADHAILATCDVPADALAATPLAAALDAPILLTCAADGDALEGDVTRALGELATTSVTLVGGSAALPSGLADDLSSHGLEVTRLAGADRYATAAAIAETLAEHGGETETALLATSDPAHPDRGWPDAISAGAYAAVATPTPILLTAANALPEATAEALDGRERLEIVGGGAAVSTSVSSQLAPLALEVSRLHGEDRYATNRAVLDAALDAGADPDTAWVATGRAFPDALAAGAAAAYAGGLLVLVDGADPTADEATLAWVAERHPAALRLAGGPTAVGEATASALTASD